MYEEPNAAQEQLARMNRRKRRAVDYGPIFLMLTVAVVGLLGASYAFNRKKAAEDEEAERATQGPTGNGVPDPFAALNQAKGDDLFLDLVPETGPRITNVAPEQLDHAMIFQSAMRRAHRGIELKDEALAARSAGDDASYEEIGRRAFRELDAAWKSIQDWELKIVDDYGTEDGQVRAIYKEITSWKKARDKFIKLPGIVDGPGSADRE